MIETIIKVGVTVILSAALGAGITYFTAVMRLNSRVKDLEKWRCYMQRDTENSLEERKLLLAGLLACLKGLQEQGCNGPVTKGIEQLEAYLMKQSHLLRSYTKENSA